MAAAHSSAAATSATPSRGIPHAPPRTDAAVSADLDQLAADIAEILASLPLLSGWLDIRTKGDGPDAPPNIVPFDCVYWYVEQHEFERDRCGRDIVVKSRQIGFTTLEIARDVQYSRLHRGVQVLIVVHDGDIAQQLFVTAQLMAESLVRIGVVPLPKRSNTREIVWSDNASAVRIVEAGESPKTARKRGRSGTIHRLHATEVAFWGSADDTLTSLIGAVPAHGEIIIESTTNGVGGRFHRDVKRADAGQMRGFKLHFWPWYRHEKYRTTPDPNFDPRARDEWEETLLAQGVTPAQMQWWRDKIDELGGGAEGLERALQEFPVTLESAFRAGGSSGITAGACDRLDRGIIKPVDTLDIAGPHGEDFGELWVYRSASPHRKYVVSADVADGGGCLSAAHVLDRQTGETCAVYANDAINAGDYGHALAAIGTLYNHALIAVERNNMGGTTLRALQKEAKYRPIYSAPDGKAGWITSATTRPLLMNDMRRAIEDGDASTPDSRVANECRAMIRDEGGRLVHGPGSTDDLFISWAIGLQLRLRGEAHQADAAKPGRASEATRAMGNGTRARDLIY